MEGAVLGICNPLLDISAEVPEELLNKYELKLNNAILAETKHMKLYEELIANYNVQYIAGGATQNSIRVCQWMSKPNSTAYMGAVGCDEYANKLENCAKSDGVRVHYMKNPDVPTGTCAVLVNKQERSLVANLAAANTFKIEHLETEIAKELIERAKIYYMSGFFLTVSVESIIKIGKHAIDNYKTVCINLSAPFIPQFFGDQLSAVIPYSDFIFGNETECLTYGESMKFGNNIEEIMLKLCSLPKSSGTRCRTVIITQGASKTLVAREGIVTSYPVEPLAKELIVDTNGAGDAFVGGFLARLMENKPISECIRSGHFAARTIIQFSGCTFPKECNYI